MALSMERQVSNICYLQWNRLIEEISFKGLTENPKVQQTQFECLER